MTSVLAFTFVLGVLVFVHELGHFLAARRVGIRVLTFSVGFGPRLWSRTVGDTEYRIGVIPVGGYVRMAGHHGDAAGRAPDEFLSKTRWERFQVLAMGPVMNLGLAWLLTAVVMSQGVVTAEVMRGPAIVGSVEAGSAALAAGIAPGDRIVSVAGRPIARWSDLRTALSATTGTVAVNVQRAGASRVVTVQALQGKPVGVLPMPERPGLVRALTLSTQANWRSAGLILQTLGGLANGATPVEDLVGPLGIASVAGEAARDGIVPLLALMAMISLNLGLFNLLPIPMLDGGHIALLAIEGIARRDLSLRLKEGLLASGFAVLVALMAVTIYNDLAHAGWIARVIPWR